MVSPECPLQYAIDSVEYSCWWALEKATEGAECAHQALAGVSFPPIGGTIPTPRGPIRIEVDVDKVITGAAAVGMTAGEAIRDKAHEWKERVEYDMAQMNRASDKLTALRSQYRDTWTSLWNAWTRLAEVNAELWAIDYAFTLYVREDEAWDRMHGDR